MSTRAREIVIPKESVTARVVGSFFSDQRWAEIQSTLPNELSAEDSARLRGLVNACCGQLLATSKVVQRGAITAQAIKKGGGKQAAPLDQLERHLRSASKILGTTDDMLDDRPGLLRRYRAQVDAMANDILKRKEALRRLAPVIVNPKHDLVRSLAKACESCGLTVTVTNRVYDQKANRPTWFQKFVAAVNDQALGAQGWGAASNDKKALYADVLRALRGRKRGDSPKISHRT